MARWPAPGRCKRRLAQGLGAGAAARIQAHLTRHTLATALQLRQRLGIEPVLAVDGLAPAAAARWAAALGVERWRLQGGGGLGLRMQRQFQRAAREGAGAVVLIGSDLPALEVGGLAAAFAALERAEAVLGPALDGGYWLIGLRRPRAELLAGIAWGGDQVLAQTRAAMARQGLEPILLSPRSDLDRAPDLLPWR